MITITPTEESFLIKKIKETDDNWLLYPKDTKEPIELQKKCVYGKLPPVQKFPWQYHELTIKRASGFITYAEMDGLILFEITEDE